MKAFFSALYVLLNSAGLTAAVQLSNEICKPRPTLVPVGYPNFDLYPFFVTLHRCGGSCRTIQPTVQRCVATKQVPLQVEAFFLPQEELKVITLYNHTECGHQCVIRPFHCHPEREIWKKDMCKCACKFEDRPCGKGFIWNKHSCDCVCNKAPAICHINKIWSTAACACVCKQRVIRRCQRKGWTLNERDCSCTQAARAVNNARSVSEEPEKSQPEAVITVRAAIILSCVELALLCVVFESFLYRKQIGFVYGLKTWLCCSRRFSSDER